jgi:hypothetical protein
VKIFINSCEDNIIPIHLTEMGFEVMDCINLTQDNRIFKARNIPLVGFEVFTSVTMTNGVFWDVTPCGSCNNRRLEGT